MSSAEILSRANAYIAAEQNAFFRGEVEALVAANNLDELTDRFYRDLEFGTGGLRGVIGGGYNRMNAFTVQRATQGLANYVAKHSGVANPSAVIAYDSRNYSDLFALEAARVLAAAGVKTYLFSSLRPTPELSYAVRQLGATTGIVVTASHNPPEYNGYKVYWNDGGQVVPPHDKAIVDEVLTVKEIKALPKDEAIAKGMLVIIDKEIDDKYIAMIKAQSIRPALVKERGAELKVVFTPLHGTGAMPVARTLSELGINVTFVEAQKEPDGNFSTVASPNPEEASALKMAIDLAKETKADLVMATDPDADRLGIAVPDANGEFVLVTGNQLGSLLGDYILSSHKENGTLPKNPAMIKTIVTTELQSRIAKANDVAIVDVLTGFKFIAEKIKEFQVNNSHSYVFGGEESYGYLIGTEVRDKDAVSAAVMTAEMALYHRSQGRSLLDRLSQIWEQYGYFEESQVSKTFKGQAGAATMAGLMNDLRTTAPKSFGSMNVVAARDYIDGTVLDCATGKKSTSIDLPSSNVLQWVLADGTLVTARPSGTEPKIKFYVSVGSKAGTPLTNAKTLVGAMVAGVKSDLNAMLATY